MSEFLYMFAQYMVMGLEGLSTGFMLDLLCHPQKSRPADRMKRAGLFWGLVLLICLPSYLQKEKTATLLNLAVTIGGFLYLMHRLYGTSLKKGMVWLCVWYALILCAEILVLLIYPEPDLVSADWTRDHALMPLAFCQLAAVFFKMAFVMTAAYRRRSEVQRDPYALILGLYLLTFLLSVPYFFLTIFREDSNTDSSTVFTLFITYVLGFLFCTCLFLIQSRTRRRQLDRLEQYYDLQSKYYSQLEQSSLKTAKIRHDYKNILASLGYLLEEGQSEEALQMLEDFSMRMEESALPAENTLSEKPDFS